jgi:hypothetical protein
MVIWQRRTMNAAPILMRVARALRESRSYNGLRNRASYVDLNGERLLVAALSDIIASKRAANRPRDRAVIDVLSATLAQKKTEAN